MKIVKTLDGSNTLYHPELNEHYHSTNGAINEALHVYIEAGLNHLPQQHVNVFEVGFGTGLNAFLTAIQAQEKQQSIHYESIDHLILPQETLNKLDYTSLLPEHKELYDKIVHAPWDSICTISEYFNIKKIENNLWHHPLDTNYDLVYFDAFGPDKQQGLWEKEIFQRLFQHMNPNALLTTYCAKGAVRRLLQEVGFTVERIPGPKGKREMIRAKKG